MDKAFREGVLSFIRSNALGEPGRYRYSAACTQPTVYSSTYAAMTMSLLGAELPDREAWADYLCAFQAEDGLIRDPVIWNEGWYENDPLWCGRPHLTSHCLLALTCLGRTLPREMTFLDPWKDPDFLVNWLENRPWVGDVSLTGNEIMNIGGLLQYARDFHNDRKAGKSVEIILEWLNTHRFHRSSGLWGDLDLRDPEALSISVQAAYHWWELYFYDGVPIPRPENAVASLLRTQNPNGGFGQGNHNPDDPYTSSACEDIDTLAPLSRLYRTGAVRTEEMRLAMEKGLAWVKSNQMPDGGFVFLKNKPFVYGHTQLTGETNQGAMFPTWFRTLTICLVEKALGDDTPHFIRCPQMQFDVPNPVT